MKTIRVRGVVGSENEGLAWDVYVDLCLDDDDTIVDHQQVEFGAAPTSADRRLQVDFFPRWSAARSTWAHRATDLAASGLRLETT